MRNRLEWTGAEVRDGTPIHCDFRKRGGRRGEHPRSHRAVHRKPRRGRPADSNGRHPYQADRDSGVTPKPPTATAKDLVRVALKLGFVFRRQSGSHAIYVRASYQARVVIPMHRGELKIKTLRGIVQDLKISVEEFANLL